MIGLNTSDSLDGPNVDGILLGDKKATSLSLLKSFLLYIIDKNTISFVTKPLLESF